MEEMVHKNILQQAKETDYIGILRTPILRRSNYLVSISPSSNCLLYAFGLPPIWQYRSPVWTTDLCTFEAMLELVHRLSLLLEYIVEDKPCFLCTKTLYVLLPHNRIFWQSA